MTEENGHNEAAPDAPAKAREPWRDEQGRFLPGNPGGPGNPMAREMARLRVRLCRTVSDEAFDLVVEKLLLLALQGHFGAIRLLLEYRAGRPERTVGIDELPLHEMRLGLEACRLGRLAEHAAAELPPEPPVAGGRPEEEWRRREREVAKAVPPAGGRPYGPALKQIIEMIEAAAAAEALRAEDEARGAGDDGASPAPVGTIADTSGPTVARAGEGALCGSGAPGWR
jgi:hypothetical protein